MVNTAIGLPNAPALGLLAGVLEFIPNVGPILAAVPAILIALFQGSYWLPLSNFWFAVLVAGLYVLIQQVEANLLIPRIMGRSLNLHPLVVLVAVILGGSLAGILGVLIAAPTVATLRVLGEYIYRRLTDQEPFPSAPVRPSPRPWLGRRLWDWLRRWRLARRWVLRPACPEDRSGMEAVCGTIWDGEDYIPEVWDEWLADPDGELTVAELDGRVVGLAKLSRTADGEWWLEGLRVHPAYRRLGLARRIQARQIEVARQSGAEVLRFATASYNRPVHRNAARDGFSRVAEFHLYGAEPLPGPFPLRTLGPADLDATWALVEGSPVWRAADGLYEVRWRWLKLTKGPPGRPSGGGRSLGCRREWEPGGGGDFAHGPARRTPDRRVSGRHPGRVADAGLGAAPPGRSARVFRSSSLPPGGADAPGGPSLGRVLPPVGAHPVHL